MRAKFPLLRFLTALIVIVGLFTMMTAKAGAVDNQVDPPDVVTVCDNGTEVQVSGPELQAYLDAHAGSVAAPCDTAEAPDPTVGDNTDGLTPEPSVDNNSDGYPNNGDNGNDAPGNPGHKVWVCHLADSSHYVLINIDWSGWDNGHSAHEGDVLLGEEPGDCPSMETETPTVTPTETPTHNEKVWVCHWADHKYVLIHISINGWTNGHSKHEMDYLVDEGERCEEGTPTTETVLICHITGYHHGMPMYALVEIDSADLQMHLDEGDVLPVNGVCPSEEDHHHHHHHGGETPVTELPVTGARVDNTSTPLYLALSTVAFAGLGSGFALRRRTR